MPRPKLTDTEKKERRVTVRFRPSELSELTEQAEVCGLSVSEFLRRRSLGRRVIPAADIRMIAELRRTAGLVKHFFNETGGVYRDKTAAILDELREVIVRVARQGGR